MADVPLDQRVRIDGEDGIVVARQTAREMARTLGFGIVDQSRIATAVSELARNVVRYATDRHGEARIRSLPPTENKPRWGIEIQVSDNGPGIADITAAMRDGFTSGPGLGMGLPGAKRLMDEMVLETGTGGTTVTVRKWRR